MRRTQLDASRYEIGQIRINWGNKKIQIITDEIRESAKQGDSKTVWRGISKLKIIK